MTKFIIKIAQYVEETCEIEVEAEDFAEAMQIVNKHIEKNTLDLEFDLDWSDGNGIHDDGIVILPGAGNH